MQNAGATTGETLVELARNSARYFVAGYSMGGPQLVSNEARSFAIAIAGHIESNAPHLEDAGERFGIMLEVVQMHDKAVNNPESGGVLDSLLQAGAIAAEALHHGVPGLEAHAMIAAAAANLRAAFGLCQFRIADAGLFQPAAGRKGGPYSTVTNPGVPDRVLLQEPLRRAIREDYGARGIPAEAIVHSVRRFGMIGPGTYSRDMYCLTARANAL